MKSSAKLLVVACVVGICGIYINRSATQSIKRRLSQPEIQLVDQSTYHPVPLDDVQEQERQEAQFIALEAINKQKGL